ncbi:hypothetical protein Tco_0311531 [Tanacetum coccineum]
MGDANPIRTLKDYSKPSHEGYRNTIELPVGNNVVPLRSDTISWNDQRDFAKPVKAIYFPQDVPSTSGRRLIEFENQVQRLMEAHLAPTQPTQVNKITSLCEICSGSHDTQYCMEDPKQAFVEYAFSRLVSNFMASQDTRLSMFEANFKQQQSEMTNKIDTVLKAITDRMAGALPSDTVKNPELALITLFSLPSLFSDIKSDHLTIMHILTSDKETCLVVFVLLPPSFSKCPFTTFSSINTVTICPKQPNKPQNVESEGEDQEERSIPENIDPTPPSPHEPSISFIMEKVRKLNSFLESSGLVPQSSDTEIVCIKGGDGDVMFIEIIRKNDDSREEVPEDEGSTTIKGLEVEYFDTFPTRSELAYHRHVHVEKAYIDLNSPLNIMTQMMYKWIMRRKLDPWENSDRGVSNFTGRIKGMHIFVGNFTYVVDFMIVEDISSIIDPRLSQVVLGRPFVEISSMIHDTPEGVVRFTNETDEVAYKMPHRIEQYNSLLDLVKEHTKSFYLRNEEDKRKGVEYVGNYRFDETKETILIKLSLNDLRSSTRLHNWYQSHGALDLGSTSKHDASFKENANLRRIRDSFVTLKSVVWILGKKGIFKQWLQVSTARVDVSTAKNTQSTKKQQTYKMIIGSIDVNAARYVLLLPMAVNTASLIFEEFYKLVENYGRFGQRYQKMKILEDLLKKIKITEGVLSDSTEYVMRKILGFYKECLELGTEYVTGMDDEGEVT